MTSSQQPDAVDAAIDLAEDEADFDVETAAEAEIDQEAVDPGAEGDAADELADDPLADDPLVEEGEIAGDYLEQLLDILDYDGDIDLDVESDRAVVSIDGGSDLDKLVGRGGRVLDAVQELTRLAVQQVTGERSRLMLDIAGYRAGIRAELTEIGRETALRVRETGERESLRPMTPFERKIVHDAVAAVDGVVSESEGQEPNRRVVVLVES